MKAVPTKDQSIGKKWVWSPVSSRAHPECDTLAYLDSDAVINTSLPSKTFDLAEKSFMCSDDVALDPRKLFSKRKPFNAGVWAVENSDAGRRIMQQWENAYPHEGWTHRKDGTWSCVRSEHTDKCMWAGHA